MPRVRHIVRHFSFRPKAKDMDRKKKHRSGPGDGSCSWTVVSLLTCLLANGIVITTQTLNNGYFSHSTRKNIMINEHKDLFCHKGESMTKSTTAYSVKQETHYAKVKDNPIIKNEDGPNVPPTNMNILHSNVSGYAEIENMFNAVVQYTPFAMKLLLADSFTMDELTNEFRKYSIIHDMDGDPTRNENLNTITENATVETTAIDSVNLVNGDVYVIDVSHRPTKRTTKLEISNDIDSDSSGLKSNHEALNNGRKIQKPKILHTAIDGEYIHCRVYTMQTKPPKNTNKSKKEQRTTRSAPVAGNLMASPDVNTRCLVHHSGVNASGTNVPERERKFVSCTSGTVQNGIWSPAETTNEILPELDTLTIL
ncbi:unnamed protein product [Owenia fusiformis]|uniref:Uncharacterized protein n=1 Tax=Owenia fusiformis TaxID=6347 RepID=A0A8J1XUF2_OWEFU|nr:unnamed protein product [Owenia fusiformis]